MVFTHFKSCCLFFNIADITRMALINAESQVPTYPHFCGHPIRGKCERTPVQVGEISAWIKPDAAHWVLPDCL